MRLCFKSESVIDLTTSQNIIDSANLVSLNDVTSCQIVEGGFSTVGNYCLYGIWLEGAFTSIDKDAIIAEIESNYELKVITI